MSMCERAARFNVVTVLLLFEERQFGSNFQIQTKNYGFSRAHVSSSSIFGAV